jgi:two-component system chemotaxis response regulator CheB
VVVGTSWGGLAALARILEALPGDFPLPVAVVQHRGASMDDAFVDALRSHARIAVREVEDKDPVAPGIAHVAPPDYHLLVDEGFFSLTVDEPVAFSRPSIDVLFESAADVYGERVVGVVLTGANEDGTRGLAAIKRAGGLAIVQDPRTAEISTMPSSALRAVDVDLVLPLDGIGDALTRLARGGAPTSRGDLLGRTA